MKIIKFLIIIFISLTTSIKADLNKNLLNQLEDGGKLIFIRHAYAPGNGDPNNFNLKDCSTQRNLSEEGRKQAQYIGEFFERNRIIKIVTQGKKFDPNLHQAMTEIEDEKVEGGTILQEIQAGYMLGERLLRPALVAVSKKNSSKNEEIKEKKSNN